MATADVTTTTINPYEAARIQRMEECKRRFEDLGIAKISKSLSVATKAIKKSKRDCKKLKTMKMIVDALGTDLRRSSRPRTTVTIYSEEAAKEIRPSRKRSLPRSSARLDYEGRVCTETERKNAFKVAGNFQRNLLFESPSFIKSTLSSHVYRGFWLGLPSKFCKNHLPTDRSEMVLEDDKGSECNSLYIGNKRGLSGGWRGFALSHNLEDGDALVFELVKHDRFKIYIFKANENGENNKADAAGSAKSKRVKKVPVSADTSLINSFLEGTNRKVNQQGHLRTQKVQQHQDPRKILEIMLLVLKMFNQPTSPNQKNVPQYLRMLKVLFLKRSSLKLMMLQSLGREALQQKQKLFKRKAF